MERDFIEEEIYQMPKYELEIYLPENSPEGIRALARNYVVIHKDILSRFANNLACREFKRGLHCEEEQRKAFRIDC